MLDLTFVTSNSYKVEEVKHRFSDIPVNIVHNHIQYLEPQANTTLEIALGSLSNLIPVLEGSFFIEDSGISVNALGGFPGPYSSYVYQTIGWEGILKLLKGNTERNAHFTSVIALYHNGTIRSFEGISKGTISEAGIGEKGFGFDPIFIPEGENLTFAQLELDKKNQISHRGRSLTRFVDFIQSNI